MQKSFFEDANEREKIQASIDAEILLKKYESAKNIECIYGVPEEAERLYKIFDELRKLNEKFMDMQAKRQKKPPSLD